MGKRIGYFAAGSDNEYHGKIVNGIHEACRAQGIDLIGFTSMLNREPDWLGDVLTPIVARGENEIFTLADYDALDGVIILSDHFNDIRIQHEIAAAAVAHKLPAIIIDGDEPGCYSIHYDDTDSLGEVIDHLIEDHHCRKINFMSGYQDNRQSIERLNAYKTALERHGIPFEEERVAYGKFGSATRFAMDCFQMSEAWDMDALVCANDTMAILSIGYLLEHGKKVPEDVIVTGFDGIADGALFCPSITTVRRATYEAGNKAVAMLIDLWNGISYEPYNVIRSVVEKRQSCGCRKMNSFSVGEYYERQTRTVNDYKRQSTDLIYLTNDLAEADGFQSVFQCLKKNANLFDAANMYFCINEDLVKIPQGDSVSKMTGQNRGYAENMVAFFYKPDGSIGTETFPRRDILPQECIRNPRRHFAHCSPLYFQEQTLGYMIVKMDEYDQHTELYYTLIRSVCNTIGEYCMRRDLEAMTERLAKLNISDPLTNLNNRRGLTEASEELVERARRENRFIIGVGIDLDDLKGINDAYGHQEGDNAILQVANAMRYAKREDMVLSRNGGDEYFALWTSENRSDGSAFITELHRYLEDYNRHSGKNYPVDCSCGSVTRMVTQYQDLEDLMRAADQIMYTVKTNKKAARATTPGHIG